MTDTDGLIADLSHYQTSVDFRAMKEGGIAAVILKASQGTYFTDHTFAPRAIAARSAGLLVGAYHYFDSGVDPVAQASYFLGIAAASGVTVTAVDFEPATAGAGEASAAAMCQAIQERTGRWPLLYTGKWAVTPANPIFSQMPLWLAEWTTAATPNLPPGFAAWELWQFESALNTVPGVVGACSRSRVNGTLADLQVWWTGGAQPTETVIRTIVDSTGTTHQIVDRATPAIPVPPSSQPATNSLLRCSMATVALTLGLCVGPTEPARDPPTQTQIAATSDMTVVEWAFDGDGKTIALGKPLCIVDGTFRGCR